MTTRPLRHRLKPLCGRCLRTSCAGAASQPWLCHLASPGMRGFVAAAPITTNPGAIRQPVNQG